jgi:uncharacterized membrane protein YfcA
MLIFLLIYTVGIAAGFINTIAGGGSILVLPVLILAGMPSPVANATNRVAILMQNITATNRFHKHGKLQVKPVIHIMIAAVIGAIIGSFFAVKVDSVLFDKILGFIFIFILVMMLRPKSKKERKSLPKWLEFLIFIAVGFYGGFIQAGVGFIFLATLNLIEKYDLVHANAVKTFIVMCYTLFAVIIFALSGKILWLHGLVLACGNSLGAYLGVKAAVKKGEKVVKIVLSIAIAIACLKLFGVFKLLGM